MGAHERPHVTIGGADKSAAAPRQPVSNGMGSGTRMKTGTRARTGVDNNGDADWDAAKDKDASDRDGYGDEWHERKQEQKCRNGPNLTTMWRRRRG